MNEPDVQWLIRLAGWHAGEALKLPEGKDRAFHAAAAVRLVDAVDELNGFKPE